MRRAEGFATGTPVLLYLHSPREKVFGVLVSLLAASGKRVVSVLFTDGESGLDQFPDRPTGGFYADRDLWPEELGAVRPVIGAEVQRPIPYVQVIRVRVSVGVDICDEDGAGQSAIALP